MRQYILVFVLTSIACLVCFKNASYFKILYEDLSSPQQWNRIEIVDEKSTFEELRDYSWEHLELLLVGVIACVVSFTIGWSASCIRKEYSSEDRNMLVSFLGDQSILVKRMEELEVRMTELEQVGQRNSLENVSDMDLGGGECCFRTTDHSPRAQADFISDVKQLFNYIDERIKSGADLDTTYDIPEPLKTPQDPSHCDEIKNDSTLLNITSLAMGEDRLEPDICYNCGMEVEPDEESLENDLETDQCEIVNGVESFNSFNEPSQPCVEHSFEASDASSQVGTVQVLSKEEMEVFEDCKSPVEKSNNVDLVGSEVHEVVETNTKIISNQKASFIPSGKDTIEAPKSKPNDFCKATLNQEESESLCRSPETENCLVKEAEKIRSNDDDNLNLNLNYQKSLSTKADTERRENDSFSRLDVCPSMLTIESPRTDTARSWERRDSSSRTNLPRGRIPQYQKLRKETKPDAKTAAMIDNEIKTPRATADPHKDCDELWTDTSSCSQSMPTTPSGLNNRLGGRRNKKPKTYAQNSHK